MQAARTSGLSEADHCATASSGCWVSSPDPSWLRPVHSTVPSASTSTVPNGPSPASNASRASATHARRWTRSCSEIGMRTACHENVF